MNLTIAIPTYNRAKLLRESLEALLPQLLAAPDCRLLILDNASDEPVTDAVADLLSNLPDGRVEIVRNRANLGLGGNLLRCFERAGGDWMWMLSDDEAVLPDAIDTIRRTLAEHPDVAFVNFASELAPREVPILTHGLDEFAEKLDSFGNCLLISTGLYRLEMFLPQLRHGFRYGGYAVGPHFAMLLATLSAGTGCLQSERRVVRYNPSQEYSCIPLALGVITMLEWPMSPRSRRLLAGKLNVWPTLKATVAHLLSLALSEGHAGNALYFFDQICSRYYYFDWSPKRRISIASGRFLLRHFYLTDQLFRWRERLLRRARPRLNFPADHLHRI